MHITLLIPLVAAVVLIAGKVLAGLVVVARHIGLGGSLQIPIHHSGCNRAAARISLASEPIFFLIL